MTAGFLHYGAVRMSLSSIHESVATSSIATADLFAASLPFLSIAPYNPFMEIPRLTLPNGNTCTVTGFNIINIIVGKNGCGKSSILKAIENISVPNADRWGIRKYITPERGGLVTYQANIENNLNADPDYMRRERSNNQAAQFREQSVALYRKLELSVLREAEKEKRSDASYTFDIFIVGLTQLSGGAGTE